MPALAQAVPHYYKNGALAAEGEKIPVVSWGRLTLEVEPIGQAGATCENLAGGYVENPVGAGAGMGATLRFASYNCTNLECPSGEIEVGGKKYEKEFEIVYPSQDFPWPGVLTEAETGKIRTAESTGFVMELACMAHGYTRQAAGEGGAENKTGIGSNEQFVLPSGGNLPATCVTTPTDKQEPQNERGTSASSPSKLVFNAGAGELSCDGGAFTSKTKESLKLQGYKAQEVITVH